MKFSGRQRIKLLPRSLMLKWLVSLSHRMKISFNFLNQNDSLVFGSVHTMLGITYSPHDLPPIFSYITLITVHNRIIKTTQLKRHKICTEKEKKSTLFSSSMALAFPVANAGCTGVRCTALRVAIILLHEFHINRKCE